MSEHRRSLQSDLHELADAFEAQADGIGDVAARLASRSSRRAGLSLTLVTAAVAVILGGVALRSLVPPPNSGSFIMPELVGVFRTIEPEENGRCVAVQLYETTPGDGRAFVFAWTGPEDCAARRSNLFSTIGRAEVVVLPTGSGGPARPGILVTGSATASGPLAGITVVLDPTGAATSTERIRAYRSVPATGDAAAIELLRVEVLDLPYVPE